ncbi:MAG: carotenoid biosynthesis protein [Bacteroidia bacterium]|nr:carotenoid biosynthesis protein [Bacteroidia bacterium]
MLAYSFVLVVAEEGSWVKRKVIPILIILFGSFLVEYIGVNRGWLFGDYQYGTALGFKFGGVPIIIAFNWVMLCIAGRSFVNLVMKNNLAASALAAVLITAFDFLLEPVAIRFGWWWWTGGEIPLFNYACWFGFAFLFQLMLYNPRVTFRGYWIILVQTIFFWVLLLM